MTTKQTTLARMYAFTLSRGDEGVTDDEVKEALDLTQNTIARSRKRLVSMGAVYPTTIKRKTRKGWPARVWKATPGVEVIRTVGRPVTITDPRAHRLTVYLNEDEKIKLDTFAWESDTPKSRLATSLMGIGYTAAHSGVQLEKWTATMDKK